MRSSEVERFKKQFEIDKAADLMNEVKHVQRMYGLDFSRAFAQVVDEGQVLIDKAPGGGFAKR